MTFTCWCKNRNHWLVLASSSNCNDGLFSARWKCYFLAKCCFLRWFSFFVCQHRLPCPVTIWEFHCHPLSWITDNKYLSFFLTTNASLFSIVKNNLRQTSGLWPCGLRPTWSYIISLTPICHWHVPVYRSIFALFLYISIVSTFSNWLPVLKLEKQRKPEWLWQT